MRPTHWHTNAGVTASHVNISTLGICWEDEAVKSGLAAGQGAGEGSANEAVKSGAAAGQGAGEASASAAVKSTAPKINMRGFRMVCSLESKRQSPPNHAAR